MRSPGRRAVIGATILPALTSCGTGTETSGGGITLTIAASSIIGGK
ncbi:hypothetical protein [Nonomuraea sp. B19D2]